MFQHTLPNPHPQERTGGQGLLAYFVFTKLSVSNFPLQANSQTTFHSRLTFLKLVGQVH